MNFKSNLKRVISGILSLAMTATILPYFPVSAEDTAEKYPYTMFAASDAEGAITVNAGNFCVNGNVATNGTIMSSGNMNINGTKTENADESMIFIFDKIESQYYSTSNVEEFTDDYTFEDINININIPTAVMGETTLTGNININTALKALEDINLYGEVKNTNDSLIFSEYGDIIIESQNVNLNGLVYAPFGDVVITAQNLNLNNVVIIADSITFECPSVNANYSSDIGGFVGNVSERFECSYAEWSYMKDENENGFPDYMENFRNYGSLLDTDEDGLPDCMEEYFGTDELDIDTDDDGLSDLIELLCNKTNALQYDTDQNDVSDGDEDFDGDSLSNLYEIEIGTAIMLTDSDYDGLSDFDEISTYFTDPLKFDTDGDTLSDGEEISCGTSPLVTDTDNDGIPDNEEKSDQTFVYTEDDQAAVIKSVTIKTSVAGSLADNTKIRNLLGEDTVCSEVVGLMGAPYEIKTECKFDSATLLFEMSESAVSQTPLEDMLVLWYDEENAAFMEMETICDADTNTVSITTTHFSKYMVVDKNAWYVAWAENFNYNPNKSDNDINEYNNFTKNYTVLAIDCSGSMYSNDKVSYRTDINSEWDSQFAKTCGRITASSNFIDQMVGDDCTGIVLFEDAVTYTQSLTSDQLQLRLALQNVYDGGGTYFLPAIEESLEMFSDGELNDSTINKRIILLSDGCDGNPSATRNYLSNLYNSHNPDPRNRVKIYTIALGNSADRAFLEEIATTSHGVAYTAETASDLVEIYSQIGFSDFDTTDTDGDGLYDAVETAGIRLKNGKIVYTDPIKKDTDGDGLEDGVEIDPNYCLNKNETKYTVDGEIKTVKGYYFNFTSYPDRKNSDDDIFDDDIDSEKLTFNESRFNLMYADSSDYSTLTENRFENGPELPIFVQEHWDISEQEWASKEDAGFLENYGCYFLYIMTFGCSLYASFPIANVTSTAWSFIAGNWEDGDEIAYGSTPNAAAMLDWYLLGMGAECELSSDMVASLILSQERNVEHYLRNLDACLVEAEYFVNSQNHNGMLECKPDAIFNKDQDNYGMYVSCFVNRGNNCPYSHSGQVSLASKHACDWNLAIGESFGTMQADVQYIGNDLYKMNYTYYVYDVYEWPDIDFLRELHLVGWAHQYKIVGYISGEITWKRGERAYNSVLGESALLELTNNLSDVKEFFRAMDINSDTIRDVLEFYGLRDDQ